MGSKSREMSIMMNNNQFGALSFITILIVSLACSTQDSILDESLEATEILGNDSLDYLALGDSYTIGQGVQIVEGWPFQLYRNLEKNDIEIRELKIVAKTGWTTRNLLDAIEDTDLSNLKNEKLVSLLIGVNNQFQNLPFEQFETEFDLLIEKAIQLAGNMDKVFVVSIPDYGVTPFGSNNRERIGQELDEYNLYIKHKCAALDIPFIDITEISRELGDSEGALASDNLHPSGLQYEKWVETILPVVLDLVTE